MVKVLVDPKTWDFDDQVELAKLCEKKDRDDAFNHEVVFTDDKKFWLVFKPTIAPLLQHKLANNLLKKYSGAE